MLWKAFLEVLKHHIKPFRLRLGCQSSSCVCDGFWKYDVSQRDRKPIQKNFLHLLICSDDDCGNDCLISPKKSTKFIIIN